MGEYRIRIVLRVALIAALISMCGRLSFICTSNEVSLIGPSASMPVVFVYPQSVSVFPGETFTVEVKVFNLSDNWYLTRPRWEPGSELGPPWGIYNYSLGNLYGFDIKLSWDPVLLDYVSHTLKVTVESYSEGVLHEPVIDLANAVDKDAGECWLARSSLSPAEPFNCPDAYASFFEITFNVTSYGNCTLSLDSVELATTSGPTVDHMPVIPHWTEDGEFRTPDEFIPELKSLLILPLFMIATLVAAVAYKRKRLT